MEPEGSVPRSQEPSTGPYPEPDRSNPYHRILSKIHFNTVHSPTSWSSYWSLSFWISHQYSICIPLRSHSCYMPCPSDPPWRVHSNYTWRRVQVMKLLAKLVTHTSIISYFCWNLSEVNVLGRNDIFVLCSAHCFSHTFLRTLKFDWNPRKRATLTETEFRRPVDSTPPSSWMGNSIKASLVVS
jgi:hypothetical protein